MPPELIQELPSDLARVLRDPSIIVPQDQHVFAAIAGRDPRYLLECDCGHWAHADAIPEPVMRCDECGCNVLVNVWTRRADA